MYDIVLKKISSYKVDQTVITTDILNFTKTILQKCSEYFDTPTISKFAWISYEDSDQFDVDTLHILTTEISPTVSVGEFRDIVQCSICTIRGFFEKGIFE